MLSGIKVKSTILLLIFITFCLILFSGCSHKPGIYGSIKDFCTKKPVNAEVVVLDVTGRNMDMDYTVERIDSGRYLITPFSTELDTFEVSGFMLQSEGSYHTDSLKPGKYYIIFFSENHGRTSRFVEIEEGEELKLDIEIIGTCHPGYIIQGMITDAETYDPIERVRIYVNSGLYGSSFPVGGDYELHGLCPGKYSLRFEKGGYDAEERIIEMNDTLVLDIKLSPNNSTDTWVYGEADTSKVYFIQEGEERKEVKGRAFVKFTGANVLKPVPGARIYVTSANLETYTDTEGNFSFNLFPGYYRFTGEYHGFLDAKTDMKVVKNRSNILNLTFNKTNAIKGKVLLASDSTTPASSIVYLHPGGREAYTYDGEYIFHNVSPGVYTINAENQTHSGKPVDFIIKQGEVKNIDIYVEELKQPLTPLERLSSYNMSEVQWGFFQIREFSINPNEAIKVIHKNFFKLYDLETKFFSLFVLEDLNDSAFANYTDYFLDLLPPDSVEYRSIANLLLFLHNNDPDGFKAGFSYFDERTESDYYHVFSKSLKKALNIQAFEPYAKNKLIEIMQTHSESHYRLNSMAYLYNKYGVETLPLIKDLYLNHNDVNVRLNCAVYLTKERNNEIRDWIYKNIYFETSSTVKYQLAEYVLENFAEPKDLKLINDLLLIEQDSLYIGVYKTERKSFIPPRFNDSLEAGDAVSIITAHIADLISYKWCPSEYENLFQPIYEAVKNNNKSLAGELISVFHQRVEEDYKKHIISSEGYKFLKYESQYLNEMLEK